MAFPQALVTRFFQLTSNRQFTEARRELHRLKESMQKNEWNHGYYRALYGMLLTQKSNGNQYAFLSNVDTSDRTAMVRHKKEFSRNVQNRFHDDFDRGFFSAWHDFVRLQIKNIDERVPRPDLETQTSIVQYAKTA